MSEMRNNRPTGLRRDKILPSPTFLTAELQVSFFPCKQKLHHEVELQQNLAGTFLYSL